MIERHVSIPTADGSADAILYRPDGPGMHPGVIQLTDGLGTRPEHEALSRRITAEGYVVLMPNVFYRTPPEVRQTMPDFSDKEAVARFFKEVLGPVTPDGMERDSRAYVEFLAAQPGVSPGPLGVVGFCFTGQFALRAAATLPDRIVAAASFHGGEIGRAHV